MSGRKNQRAFTLIELLLVLVILVVLAAVVLGIILAIVWMSFAVRREERERDRAEPISGEMGDHCLRALRQQDADPVAPHDPVG